LKALAPEPPFLVFPDRAGGFFVFHQPQAVFSGPELSAAESFAQTHDAWLAGGLEYAAAEGPAPGWWGVFPAPMAASWNDLEGWADPGPVFTIPLGSPVSQDQYATAFAGVRAALVSGVTYQVNLTFPLEGRAVAGSWSWRSALRLWLELVRDQGREASFAVLGPADQPTPILVSASPELFFQREGPTVEARPMKGTAIRHSDPARDAAHRHELATGTKTRAENLMVTDMLRNDLGRLAVPGGISVPQLFEVEAYPTVWQMTSTVRAQVPAELTLTALMGALFPCASITGAPKVSTQRVITATEAFPRGWYTGTLGWHRPGSPLAGPTRSRFSVLIRTLVFGETGAFRLGVGGGVVWDSTAEGEWAEAWAKARFLASSRRTFSLTEAILWEPGAGYFLLPEHEARLQAACRDFGGTLVPGTLEAELDTEVARLHAAGLPSPFKLRVLVDPQFRLRVEGEPLPFLPDELKVGLAPRAFGPDSLVFRKYKTTDRRVYDENKRSGVDQTIHFNERGELTESTSMTLVLEKEGRFLTPALSSGLLDGTFRTQLLAEGRLEEAVLPVGALEEAERVWLVNSVRRWKATKLISG